MVGELIKKKAHWKEFIPTYNYPKTLRFSVIQQFSVFSSPTSIIIWHQRLAQVNYKTIMRMSWNQLVDGLQLSTNPSIPKQLCLRCVSGKMRCSPFLTGRSRANEIGQLIHSDVCGHALRYARKCKVFRALNWWLQWMARYLFPETKVGKCLFIQELSQCTSQREWSSSPNTKSGKWWWVHK